MKLEVNHRSGENRRYNKRLKRLWGVGAIYLTASALGFWIDPVYLRIIWILLTGTATVISGILIYLVVNKLIQ